MHAENTGAAAGLEAAIKTRAGLRIVLELCEYSYARSDCSQLMLAEYIDSIFTLLVGIYASAVGFGVIAPPASSDPVAGQQWLARYGKLFRIIGPLLVVIALVLAAGQYFRLA